MAKIVTFGEIMMRLATPGHLRFAQTPSLDVTFGGGEANVAASLALFGHHAAFVTKLPADPWGDRAVATLRGLGVDTTHVVRGGGRIGVYFLETGAGPRASNVVYDRADSAVSKMTAGEVDWPAVFDGVDWFHWTGITPALGEGPRAAVAAACGAAAAAGATVSVDLNFRRKLWTSDEARRAMEPLMEHVSVCVANEEDAEKVFGVVGSDARGGRLDRDRYADVARQLAERFGFDRVAITLRESVSASRNGWSALLYAGNAPHFSRRYDLDVVDRVGGGDSFAAGLVHAILSGLAAQAAVNWAAAASALKHTIPGDLNLVSAAEVDRLADGDASGRVRR